MCVRRPIVLAFLCALGALLAVPPAQGGERPVVVVQLPFGKEPAKATFVDPDTLAVIGSAGLKATPWPVRYDATGSVLYAFGADYSGATTVPGTKAWTLWSIDTATFTSTLIGDVGRPPFTFFTDPGGTRLYVAGLSTTAKTNRIAVFDLAARKPLGTLASVERMKSVRLAPDGSLVYALCRGMKHTHPKGPSGNLHVLDASTGTELARFEAGPDPSSVAFDATRGLAYVLGAAGMDGRGYLTVLRADAVVARLTLTGRPHDFATGPGGTGYVLAKDAVIELAADGLSVARKWPLDFDPASIVFDADRGRMFVSTATGSNLAELDLKSGDVVVAHPTGREGVKVGKGFGIALAAALSVGQFVPNGVPVAPETFGEPATPSMFQGPDGAFVYVLNLFTRDVSLYDTARHDVVGYIPTGGGTFRMVHADDDANLWIESREQLVRLNTSSNLIDRTIPLDRVSYRASVGYDLPGRRAWIAIRTKVLVVNLKTGDLENTVELSTPAFAVWIENRWVREPTIERPDAGAPSSGGP
jgi:DNA-binding beta-propeller fold protein YncE